MIPFLIRLLITFVIRRFLLTSWEKTPSSFRRRFFIFFSNEARSNTGRRRTDRTIHWSSNKARVCRSLPIGRPLFSLLIHSCPQSYNDATRTTTGRNDERCRGRPTTATHRVSSYSFVLHDGRRGWRDRCCRKRGCCRRERCAHGGRREGRAG